MYIITSTLLVVGYQINQEHLLQKCEVYHGDSAGKSWIKQQENPGRFYTHCTFIKTHEPCFFGVSAKPKSYLLLVDRAAVILRHPFDSAFSEFKRYVICDAMLVKAVTRNKWNPNKVVTTQAHSTTLLFFKAPTVHCFTAGSAILYMSNHLSKSIVWKFVAFSVLRKSAYRGIPVAFGHIYWVFVRRQLRTLTLLTILATTTPVICAVAAHIKAVMADTAAAYCGLDNILGVAHQYSWWTSGWLKCELTGLTGFVIIV